MPPPRSYLATHDTEPPAAQGKPLIVITNFFLTSHLVITTAQTTVLMRRLQLEPDQEDQTVIEGSIYSDMTHIEAHDSSLLKRKSLTQQTDRATKRPRGEVITMETG